MRKFTVKAKPSPSLTDCIRALMKMRDMAKLEAKKSGFPSDWAVYRKLRNYGVKANRESRREYVQNAIYNRKKDVKSMCKYKVKHSEE